MATSTDTNKTQDSLVESLVNDTIEGLFQNNDTGVHTDLDPTASDEQEAYTERKSSSDIDNDPIQNAGGTPI